jgi:hypothetical protein
MKTRLLTILLAAGSVVAAVFTGLSIPAAAQTQTVPVQTPSGEIVNVQVDVPPGSTLDDIQLPGTPVGPPPPPPNPPPPHHAGPEAGAGAQAGADHAGPRARAWTAERRRRVSAGSDEQRRADQGAEREDPQDHRRG